MYALLFHGRPWGDCSSSSSHHGLRPKKSSTATALFLQQENARVTGVAVRDLHHHFRSWFVERKLIPSLGDQKRKPWSWYCIFFHWAICFFSCPVQSPSLTALSSEVVCTKGSFCALVSAIFSKGISLFTLETIGGGIMVHCSIYLFLLCCVIFELRQLHCNSSIFLFYVF